MSEDLRRISFHTKVPLYEKSQKIPWGIRSAVLRILLERVIDAADKKGEMIYGAVLGGDFTLVFKDKGDEAN